MKAIVPEARWDESRHYWKCNVQKDGVRKSFYEKTEGRRGKRVCEAKAQEWVESNCPTDMKFAQAWDKYIESKKGHISDHTLAAYARMGRLHLIPTLGAKKLSAITAQDWQSAIDKYAREGATHFTLSDLRSVISGFAAFARRSRFPVSDVSDLQIPKSAPRAHRSTLQPEHLKTLFSVSTTTYHKVAHDDHYIHAFRFAVVTGLRRGELCGLRWEDFGEDFATVSIRRSIAADMSETPGKTANAHRTFCLPARAREELRQQREYLRSIRLVTPWVFPGPRGGVAKPQSVVNHWHAYCEANGIPHYVFHELRHTAVSMYGADVPEKLLKAAIGHSESMDTLGVYGHSFGDESSRAASAMDAVLERVLG